jgi:cellulose synthase/poly-beta-1,6-N-acetylglucosamine synthase-like glycosyltransferase
MELLRIKWRSLPAGDLHSGYVPQTSVSVIVPARNEAPFLDRCLGSLVAQDFPPHLLEIIVVDDHSEDETAAIAQSFESRGVDLISLPQGQSSKKAAIQAAIALARGELIATIDADCEAPPGWLSTMIGYYEKHRPALLAGPVAFFDDGPLPRQFQALDMLGMTAVAGAGIRGGWFHMGNGANLVYERSAFYQAGGFGDPARLASGDDVLLMQKMAKAFPGKIAYVKSRDALIMTEPAPDLEAFWNQRLRWGGKAVHYDEWKLKALAAVVLAGSAAVLFSFLAIPWLGMLPFLAALTVKSLADYRFLAQPVRFFGKESLLSIFWQAQFIHVLYIALSGAASLAGRPYLWKGRRVR